MARRREVGTLWIGGRLSWMEVLCLKSFVDQGQRITLFSYEDIPNVPDGVIRADGREIYDTDDFIKYEKKDSFALFADLFRLMMIRARPGMIWVDTDVYCHRVMDYDSDYVMGFELPGAARVNNAVLGLPADCPMLAAMLGFMSDRHAIPPFVKPRLQDDYRRAAAKGAPVHVSAQPWGVWGPMMLTHFVAEHGMLDRVMPLEAFYPVTFPDRQKMLRPARVVESALTPATTALHLWASNKRELGLRHDGLPPKGSYLAKLVAKHGIVAAKAPIAGRGRHVFDAGLLDAAGLQAAGRVADIGGTGVAMMLAAHHRWGAAVDLIDLLPDGRFADVPSAWVKPALALLGQGGVPEGSVRVVSREEDLRPAQFLVTLGGFGDTAKIKHFTPVLERALAPGARLLLDIRKGSGAYPFLKAFGEVVTLSNRDEGGVQIARAMLCAPEVVKTASPDTWEAIARTLAGPDGFTRDNGAHSMLYIPRGDTLVVTFDNLDIAMTKREDRRPWGFAFIEKQGFSMLGVMANGWTWYRDPWVSAQFDDLRDSGFFKRFKRVVFYGASMGGYAACAFVAACPGADVVAISPQSTLDKSVVPWETRYKTAWGADFSGPYGDAATASHAAGRVTLLYDPYEPLDKGHVDRFTGPNVVKLRTPLLGHRLGSSLQQMGILSPITLGALNGTLTQAEFYRSLRARKTFPRYQKELFERAVARGRPELARKLGRFVLTRGSNRAIRKGLAALDG